MSATGGKKTLMGRFFDPSPRVVKILEEQSPPPTDRIRFERQTRAVLFSDIVGSTAFFERYGDEAGMTMVERHNQLLFPQVEIHGGHIIKTIGDAIMASYQTAAEAVRSAVAMQKKLKEHNSAKAKTDRIHVRIGINMGEVIHRGRDLFGDVVNAAARIEALAVGGQILISLAVCDGLGQEPEFPCAGFDAVRVKGKQAPLEVLQVRWDPDAPLGLHPAVLKLEPGDVVGDRFEILGLLGEGGMGQVQKARDRALDELVALKFIRADLSSNPDTLSRFKQEVRLARSITHQNICRIHEFLEMQNQTFLSMELVHGINLEQLLQEQHPLPADRIVEIGLGICSGLAEAHRRGVTHRDLKPGNVMIEEETGRVVIMDFGIARLATTQRATQAGLVVGTPEYMSPEQAQGTDVGPASDIYSMGAILYELITGQPPHTADTPVAVAVLHLTAEPRRPAALNPAVPARLEAVILKCLCKNPKRRFHNVRALSKALRGEQAVSSPGRLTPVVTGITGLVVVAILTVLAAVFFRPTDEAPMPTEPQQIRHLVSSAAVESTVRWSPDGKFFAFLRDGDAWVSAYPKVKPIRSTTGATAVDDPNLADLTWNVDGSELFFPISSGSTFRLVRTPAFGGSPVAVIPNAAAADVSPDGQRVAFTKRDPRGAYSIAISRPDGAEEKAGLPGDTSVAYLRPRWSPDGKKLAVVAHFAGYNSARDIGVYDLKANKLNLLTQDGRSKRAYNTDPAWSADGKWIVYASKRSGTMCLWKVPAGGGESQPITQGATEDQRGPDVSPEGTALLFRTAGIQLDVSLLELGSRDPEEITRDVWSDRFPAWSPDGKRIAFRSQRTGDDPTQQSVVLYHLKSKEEQVLPGPPGIRDFAWCGNDGIVYAATVGTDRRLGLLKLESGESRLLVEDYNRIWTPNSNPDCRLVVFCGKRSKQDSRRIWRAEVGGAVRRLNQEPGFETFPAQSPNGKWIAYRWAPSEKKLGEAELRVVPAEGDSESTRTVTRHASFRRSRRRIRWSPDGRFLYYVQATAAGGRLFKVKAQGGEPRPVAEIDDIHTFDYDLSPDGRSLVYPRVIRSGDLFVLENVHW
jgi:Tol biopolymer transport system component/class 3 adenylate cyclase/predicted Ser/Thr protein kinase